MYRRLSVLFLFLFALLPLAPAQPPPQELARPASQEAEAVVREVNQFYVEYWRAWEERDADRVSAALAADFVGMLYQPSGGVAEFDKPAEVAGIRQFFQVIAGQDVAWRRRLLGVVPRTKTEAVATLRSDFSLGGVGGEIELSLEVLRKQPDGRWVLARKYTEKIPF